MDRPSTPPRQSAPSKKGIATPPTPEVTRRLEESRLRAKAIRDQREAADRASGNIRSVHKSASGFVPTEDIHVVGADNRPSRKRPFDSITRTQVPTSNRDARVSPVKDAQVGPDGQKLKDLRPAKAFAKFVDYEFSSMTDTKGGFLSTEDDPHNKSMSAPGGPAGPGQNPDEPQKPKHMSMQEWERLQILRKLQRRKEGPFEPGLSALVDKENRKKCRECGNFEIDWVWEEVFDCCVCNGCKEKFPDKYSLLTKTECREDYLITDPELKDTNLLPHLSRPNPHKSHWHDMWLFMRFQVEEYAFTHKWGSAEKLDEEFERREQSKKKRKEDKFKEKLLDLKRKTRTDAYRRGMGSLDDGGATKFGDAIGSKSGRHVHDWGRAIEDEEGMSVKKCNSCGMEVEELVF